MSSIFTKIIRGEIQSYKVAETDDYYAFLDINPVEKGHTLIVPKKEIDYIFDLDDNTLSGMLPFAKRVGKAIEATITCERIGLAVVGLEVPHAHIHLIPINGMHDIDFARPKLKFTQEEFEATARAIRDNLKI
jgi:histidine triad (HIT) family protein